MQYETIRKDYIFELIEQIKSYAKRDAIDCPDITKDYIEGWENSLEILELKIKRGIK